MSQYKIALTLSLISISYQFIFGKLIVDEEPKATAQLKKFINHILQCRNESEIVVAYETENMDAWYFKTNTIYLASSKSGLQTISKQLTSEPSFYLFSSFTEKILEYLYILNSTYTRSTNYFIIMCPSNHNANLLESIWKTFRFLDCFLVTCNESSVKITTYNPFFKKTISYQHETCEIFSNKASNLNGFKLSISFFEDPPRTIIHNGVFEGKSARLMKLVLEKINGTAELVVPKKVDGSYFIGATKDLEARRCDISFMEHFTTKMTGNDRSYSYPHQLNDFVVVVTKSSKIVNYFNVYEIFDFATWMLVLFGILLTMIYRTWADKRSDIGKSFLFVWSGITGVSLDATFNASKKIKFVFLVWIMGCLILDIIVSSLLASKMIKPKVRKDINTIEELKEINPKILMSVVFIKDVPKEYGISQNLFPTSHLERKEALQNLDDKTAVVIASSIMELIDDKTHLHVLKEHLLPGFALYRFQPKSPFLKTIDDIIFKDIEYGITKFNENFTIKYKHKSEHTDSGKSLLKFIHIRNIFLILIIGHTIAAVVLFVEIAFKYLSRASTFL